MILAKDLRVGNLFKGIAGLQTVLAIEDNTERGKYNMDQYNGYSHLILCEENGNQYKPWEIEGIPLTQEWMLKLGFMVEESKCQVKTKILSIQVSNNDSLYFDDNQWYISHEWNNNNFQNTFWNQPKYVHQLQNLYYHITGEELTLKD